MKKSYAFAGSFATLAVVLAITTTHYSEMIAIRDLPVPAAETKSNAAAVAGGLYAGNKPAADEEKRMDVVSELEGSGRERDDLSTSLPSAASVPMEAKPEPLLSKDSAMKTDQPSAIGDVKKKESAVANRYAAPESRAMSEEAVAPGVAGYAGAAISSRLMAHPHDQQIMPYPYPQPPVGQDKFDNFKPNPVKVVAAEPVSTFSIDADTASYSFVRRAINGGQLPPRDAVRVEEMINYFPYEYQLPSNKEEPFAPKVTVFTTPWNPDTKLMHVSIKGYDIDHAKKPRSNLVFLIDVSGSMSSPDKLPLVQNSLRMLLDSLSPDDTVGIVVYAGSSGTVLEPTKVSQKHKILEALGRLEAGGSTAGGQGIEQAYALAQANFDKDAVNRVILATDGDFNVGITDQNQLRALIEQKRVSGIFLSILGYGQGNYNDALMQTLAQSGNGTAAYIDTLNEARKVLVEEAGSTLFTIAKDVKIQVEFNPSQVAEYRLVGYESRLLNREDFNNDRIDAGEVGAGHAVTAIYEIRPVGSKPQSDPLRYNKSEAPKPVEKGEFGEEYAFVKIRYKLPDENVSKLMTQPVSKANELPLDVTITPGAKADVMTVSNEVRFATAVAVFGQMLKGDPHVASYTYDQVIALADSARGKDAFGYRAEFVNLVRLAKSLSGAQPTPMPATRE